MYTVIGKPMTRTFRVLWALEEMGLPYELNPASPQSADVVSLNPSGKVPVLQDDDETITDSTAIITYLADKHAQLTALAGTPARARQDAMTQMCLDEVDALLWTAARHSFALPPQLRMPEVKTSLKWEFARNLNRIGQQIKGPYLMGEEFTIADIVLGHCLNWSISAKFPIESQAVLDYGKRLRAREAHQRVRALAR